VLQLCAKHNHLRFGNMQQIFLESVELLHFRRCQEGIVPKVWRSIQVTLSFDALHSLLEMQKIATVTKEETGFRYEATENVEYFERDGIHCFFFHLASSLCAYFVSPLLELDGILLNKVELRMECNVNKKNHWAFAQ
ncbi:hypothetical protein PMAYCL1PPCAC_23219, partial [Pristionchus mayeri]